MASTYNIGVIGIGGSGKTVFLMSLIDHIMNHEPDRFKLTPQKRNAVSSRVIRAKVSQVEISQPKENSPIDSDNRFPYEQYRKRLVDQNGWPQKTRDWAQSSLSFRRSDWRSTIDLNLFDFPGERFADSSMLDCAYAEWSDRTLEHLRIEEPKNAADFLHLQVATGQTAPDEKALIDTYRLALAKMVNAFRPFITPSSFLLSDKGYQPKHNQADEEMLNTCFCGQSVDKQFVPLGSELRAKNPDLVKKFTAHYGEYRKNVLGKVFNRLRQCNGLIVLVDIPEIICSGVNRLNDCEQIIGQVLKAANPGAGLLYRGLETATGLILPSSWQFNHIERIVFAATKSDLVRYCDQGRLRDLLHQLVHKAKRNLNDGVKTKCVTCAAINSTEMVNDELYGKLMYNEKGEKVHFAKALRTKIAASPLFDQWPKDGWSHKDFFFPAVHPMVPQIRSCPPQQAGVDDILDFMLGTAPEAHQ